ncbi:lipid A core-O-antigen ligase-like enyme [Hoeflea sp. IMCC20628]|uniref:O-antigen ligase family protein n=1 Tax=Hoeflea sp. IMCC20628 TaxID=1620421 RepID=UPI00063AF079|nr:O-antigen ligase family protein [Hoeflea sp. IMCC20628]AKI02649.1 lipid A core-O-antigen ligase-like enyme [Hoeflea sp. IMCC20628]
MTRKIIDFLFKPDFRNYDWINLSFYGVNLCLGAFLGSFVSVYVISTGVFATLHFATGRLKWALPRPVNLVFYAFCGLFLVDLIAAAFHPSKIALNEIAENLPFLGFAGIYSITFIDRVKLHKTMETLAAAASFLGALLIILDIGNILGFGDTFRPELATGNSSVLALLGGILYVFNVGAAVRRRDFGFWMHFAAAACSLYLVIATGTRAMWPVLLIIPLLGLFFFRSFRKPAWELPIVALVLAGSVALVSMYSESIRVRFDAAQTDIQNVYSGDLSGSIGKRVQIYKAGLELFLEKPLLGYGPGNEREEIAKKTLEAEGVAITFSHAHNAFLNAALRAGVLGLLALCGVVIVPFVMAWRAERDDVGQAGFFTLCGILAVYMCSGLTGLMLGHDIHDAVYIAAVCYSLYLVFGREEKGSASAVKI